MAKTHTHAQSHSKSRQPDQENRGTVKAVTVTYADGNVETIDVGHVGAIAWTNKVIGAKGNLGCCDPNKKAKGTVCKWQDPPGEWEC